MLMTVAIAAIVCQVGTAADYFPLEPGTRKVYEHRREKLVSQQIDVAADPVEIDGQTLIPVETSVSGQVVNKVYYRITGDTVYSVATYKKADKELCSDPIPILKVGEKKNAWVHAGLTSWFGSPYPITVKAEANYLGIRKVLGKNVPVIEVKYLTTMGSGEGVADVPIKMTALYAKGIGMIEQSDESKVGKVVTKQTLKLIDFTPGHPAAPKN